MTYIRNPSIFQDAQKQLNSLNADFIPPQTEELVRLVIPITPVADFVRSQQNAVPGTTAVLVTLPTDKDFFLTGLQLNLASDAANDTTSASLQVRIENQFRVVGIISKLALVAISAVNVPSTFVPPIRIDRGTDIRLVLTGTVGGIAFSGIIFGFMRETTRNPVL